MIGYVLMALGGIVLLAIAVVLVMASTKPKDFRVSRSAVIGAPREVVFPLINNLQEGRRWSPWENLDPGMQRTFEGPPAGPGAVYTWSGNNKVGAGRLSVVSSKPPEHVEQKLEFTRPFKATNRVVYTLESAGKDTRVTWAMHGTNNFMSKVMMVFMDCEKMVGRDFERGLANLNEVARGAG